MSSTAVPYAATDKAGFWIRFVAYLIDWVLIIIVTIILGAIFRNQALQSAISSLVFIGYLVYFWSASGGGQTLGQRALKLRVVKTDGSQLDYGGALIRAVGLIIAWIPLGLGLAWVGWDPNKQGWHDKIAGTYVVKA